MKYFFSLIRFPSAKESFFIMYLLCFLFIQSQLFQDCPICGVHFITPVILLPISIYSVTVSLFVFFLSTFYRALATGSGHSFFFLFLCYLIRGLHKTQKLVIQQLLRAIPLGGNASILQTCSLPQQNAMGGETHMLSK